MTTIAYKNGIIAYDSRMCRGDLILSDEYEKKHEVDGVIFIVSGITASISKIIDKYFKKSIDLPVEANAVVFDGKQLSQIGFDPKGEPPNLWESPIHFHIPDAWGSGADHAITAMDMEATAEEAVKWAMKRDVNTGGKINTIKIAELKTIEGVETWIAIPVKEK